MKRILTIIIAFSSLAVLNAQEYRYTDAQSLTVVSKLLPTENPYHRIETSGYDGFTSGEKTQCRQSAGIAIAFRTNSDYIGVDVK